MSGDAGGVGETRSAVLRAEFDSSFARAPAVEGEPPVDVLAIRVGSDPYALLLSEVAGLHADKIVTALPGSPPALLGVTGLGGDIVAVYDLEVLLGGSGGGERRWMVLTAPDARVALSFEHFDGHVRVPADDLVRMAGTPGEPGRAAVRTGEVIRPVVPVEALVESVKRAVAPMQAGHRAERSEAP